MGTVRQRFFSPRVKARSYEELNAWLADRCVAWAKAHRHPERPEATIWEAFEAERPSLVPYSGPFDGFHAVPAAVSKTCLVRFDSNKYSVSASAVGRPVEVRAYASRIEIRQDGRVVGEHPRAFGRGKTVYDPCKLAPVSLDIHLSKDDRGWMLPRCLRERRANGSMVMMRLWAGARRRRRPVRSGLGSAGAWRASGRWFCG